MFQDPRSYQIAFLSLFLLLGIGTRDWTLQPSRVAIALLTCCAMQWLLLKLTASVAAAPADVEIETPIGLSPSPLSPSAFLSPTITALGLSLILRTDHWQTMALASIAAITSKFLLQVNGKHLFNPANFGIVTVLLFTHDAWISPGQWGESAWYAALFLFCGALVLQKVGRWDTSGAFLVAYAGLEALRNLYLGWTWDVWAHRLMSGSLVMFALFMITDPRTIPNSRRGRLLWAVLIALGTFGLRNALFINTAVFWVLFAMAPLSSVIDRIWVADRFTWQPPRQPIGETSSVI
jgi:Na+-transporting NADH:ubiquinone oxidoreductase subunit NqrB